MRDYAQYKDDTTTLRTVDSGWERSYRGNFYLDTGLRYKPKENLTFSINGYNLLGIFDKDLNKRNYYSSDTASYRSQAPAVALSMMYKF